jgi:hypothetical protein
LQTGYDFIDREVFIRAPSRSIHLICTAKPIVSIDQRITNLQRQVQHVRSKKFKNLKEEVYYD